MVMEKSEIANRIKELREAKKMTQNALANAAGVSPTYIYQLERGEKSPTVEYLDHIVLQNIHAVNTACRKYGVFFVV